MNLGEKPVEVLKNLEMGSEKPWKYQNPEQALGGLEGVPVTTYSNTWIGGI